MPTSSPPALWLGAISLGYGIFTIIRSPGSGILILVCCSFGVLLLALGLDARRLWSIPEALKIGVFAGTVMLTLQLMVGQRIWLAPVALVGCTAAALVIAGVIQWLDKRLVAKMARAYRDNQPIEPYAIKAVVTARPVVFGVAFLLVEWSRYDLLEQLAIHSFVPHADSLRKFYLALALHARGRQSEAMELARTTNQLDQGPYVRDQWEQLVAQIRIASGEADDVAKTFSPQPHLKHPALAAGRALVLADAYAKLGDVTAAQRILDRIGSIHGRAYIDRIRASHRPAAIVAQKLLDQPDSPYR